MRQLMIVVSILIVASALAMQEPVQTSTGFCWPTGIPASNQSAGFLAAGGNYFPGQYHLGQDIVNTADNPAQAKVNDRVFAICAGKVKLINARDDAGWGVENCAVVIQHQTKNGKTFFAVYGHINVSSLTLRLDQEVQLGQMLGRLGNYQYGVHLHFGIMPGAKCPTNNLGNAYLPPGWQPGQPLDSLGWVDPIKFITVNESASTSVENFSPVVSSDGFITFCSRSNGSDAIWSMGLSGENARCIDSLQPGMEFREMAWWRHQLIVLGRLMGKDHLIRATGPSQMLAQMPAISEFFVREDKEYIAIRCGDQLFGVKPGENPQPIVDLLTGSKKATGWAAFMPGGGATKEIWRFRYGSSNGGAVMRFVAKDLDRSFVVSPDGAEYEFARSANELSRQVRAGQEQECVVASNRSGNWQIWKAILVPLEQYEDCEKNMLVNLIQLTSKGESTQPYIYTAGGKSRICFTSTRGGSRDIFTMDQDGKDVVRLTYGGDREGAKKAVQGKKIERAVVGTVINELKKLGRKIFH